MNWNTFYEKFFDWSASTQIRRLSSLTSFGPSAEVVEVAQGFMDTTIGSRFIKKALAAGVQFTPEEIYELTDCCDTATMNLLLKTAQCSFTQEQLEDLNGIVDEAVLHEAARRNHVTLFHDDDEEEEIDEDDFVMKPEPPQKIGFFSILGPFLGLLLSLLLGLGEDEDKGGNHAHGGTCDGDCANCPAHYGYRYGRWYYGHHHVHGCEFGGNGGL